jgi:GNAT superfamily N-acetyltransferase
MLTIRKAKKQDIAALIKIYQRAYDRTEEGEKWSALQAKALLDFYFNQKTFIGFVAVLDKKIVGAFFSFIKPWHDGNRLGEGELFVDPNYQGNRIGSKLLLRMLKIAQKKKCVIHELVAYGRIARWYRALGVKNSGLHHMEGDIKEIIKKIEHSI